MRQDTLLIDLFHLDSAITTKRKVMYLTGGSVPLHWLQISRRRTRECLARKSRIPSRFDERYGSDGYEYVCDYWASIESSVEIVDLTPLVPGLAEVFEQGPS